MTFVAKRTPRKEALQRLTSQRYFIYALVDPRDGLPRYIGRSIDPAVRFAAHCGATGHGAKRVAWIKELRSLGLTPVLWVVREALGVVATIRAEQDVVDEGRAAGWPLLNRPGSARGGTWSLGRRDWWNHWHPRHFERELRRLEAAP